MADIVVLSSDNEAPPEVIDLTADDAPKSANANLGSAKSQSKSDFNYPFGAHLSHSSGQKNIKSKSHDLANKHDSHGKHRSNQQTTVKPRVLSNEHGAKSSPIEGRQSGKHSLTSTSTPSKRPFEETPRSLGEQSIARKKRRENDETGHIRSTMTKQGKTMAANDRNNEKQFRVHKKTPKQSSKASSLPVTSLSKPDQNVAHQSNEHVQASPEIPDSTGKPNTPSAQTDRPLNVSLSPRTHKARPSSFGTAIGSPRQTKRNSPLAHLPQRPKDSLGVKHRPADKSGVSETTRAASIDTHRPLVHRNASKASDGVSHESATQDPVRAKRNTGKKIVCEGPEEASSTPAKRKSKYTYADPNNHQSSQTFATHDQHPDPARSSVQPPSKDVNELDAMRAKSVRQTITPTSPGEEEEADEGEHRHRTVQDEVESQLAQEMEIDGPGLSPPKRHDPLLSVTSFSFANEAQSSGDPPKAAPLDARNSTVLTGLRTPQSTIIAASAALRTDIALSLAQKVERALGAQLGILHKDTAHATKAYLERARLSVNQVISTHPPRSKASDDAATKVFASLRPLAIEVHNNKQVARNKVSMRVETWPLPHAKGVKKVLAIPVTSYRQLEDRNAPKYTHFVRLQKNILTPNVMMMNCWPYFGDDHTPVKADYEEHYAMDIDTRPFKLERLQKAQWLQDYANATIDDLEICWEDVLVFLFTQTPNVGPDPGARLALQQRSESLDTEFPNDSPKWLNFVSNLPYSKQANLAKAAIFCDEFRRLAKLSAWHVVRRSQVVRDHFRRQEEAVHDLSDRECRVCYRFDCPCHGEYEDNDDDTSESDYESDEAVAADIINPPNVNFRKRVKFSTPDNCKTPNDSAKRDRRNKSYWEAGNYTKPDDMGPFYPCHHPGISCDQANCSCFVAKLPCEKFCSCSPNCARKFQGCSCSAIKARKANDFVCFKDDRCVCYQMGRECDPDLCGSCGVCDILDPIHKGEDKILTGRCRNASIQRGVPKHTILGNSPVHELGLFACETMKPHDFVGEYKGEIITKEEADRRGAIYEHQKLSYLFSLNKDQEIDSTYFGNKIRFINHNDRSAKNIYAVIMLVNTVHRIALFADRSIKPGEELFFDYGPQFPTEQLGGKKVRKSAPHVRNANLLDTFCAVESEADGSGTARAKKTVRRGRPRKADGEVTTGTKGRTRPTERESADDFVATNAAADVGPPTEHISPEDRLAAYNIGDDRFLGEMKLDGDEDFAPIDSEVDSSDEEEMDMISEPRGRGRPRKMRM